VEIRLLPIQAKRIAEEEGRPPQFTGNWEVDTSKSDFGTDKGLSAYKKMTYRVQHAGESLSIQGVLEEKPSEQEDWVPDGQVRGSSIFGQDVTKTATWDGRALIARKEIVACVLRACGDGRTMHVVVVQRWQQTPGNPDNIKLQETLTFLNDAEQRVFKEATRTLIATRTSRVLDAALAAPATDWTTDMPKPHIAGTWRMNVSAGLGGAPIGGDCVIAELPDGVFEGRCDDDGTKWDLRGKVIGDSVTWSKSTQFGPLVFKGAFTSRNFLAGKTDFANGMSKGTATAIRRLPTQ
jgi:hypothetical protein